MKKKLTIAVILIAAAVLLGTMLSAFLEYTRVSSSDKDVIVQIPKGASEKKIAQVLKENGVIDYEINFRLKIRKSPYRGKLNYGKYTLKKDMKIEDAIEELSKPSEMAKGIKLTVPEGFSAEMIAVRCENLGICNEEDFLRELEEGEFDYDFIKDIPDNDNAKYKLQGYLFPSTHIISKNASAYDVINTLLGEFEKQYDKVKDMLPKGMSMAEAINRAALIEREAKLDREREMISGVIDNRINDGMILQIDASVVYAISDGLYDVERVLYRDLEVDSLYNTYKYAGLPVGPICNPGLKSIRAAMNPAEHNYFYYHTDTEKNDGSHIFSETYSQHLS